MSNEAMKLALDLATMHHTDEGYDDLRSKVRVAAKEALAKQEQGEPVAKMTAHRAMYFMERFKREEKLLGPNEQAALDYVIAMLVSQQEQSEPVAWMLEQGPHVEFEHMDYHDGVEWTPLYTTPQQHKPLTVRVWAWVWKDKLHEGDLYIPSYTPAQHVPRGELLALVDPADLHNPLENTVWHIPSVHCIKGNT